MPLLACSGDPYGTLVLGQHDGLSSWTVNAAADPAVRHREFVPRHEEAHHRLH